MINKKSIIEITDLIEEYKQAIYWKSLKLKKIYDKFYNKIGRYGLYILQDYKLNGYKMINTFLYDRENFFINYDKSLFSIIDSIFKNRKTIDLTTLKSEFVNNIFYTFYRIIKSIIEIDNIFKKCPKTTEEYYVYRGIDFKDKHLEENMLNKLRKLKKGDIFSFENYLSTSLLNDQALEFLDSHFVETKLAKCCLFRIKIPKNSKVLYLDSELTVFSMLRQRRKDKDLNTNNHPVYLISEYELLLPRSCQLKYIDSYTIKGKVPTVCSIKNLDKTRISDVYVYDFEMIGVDSDREKFDLNDFVNIKDIQKVFKTFHHMNFKISKYDLYHFSKMTNIKDLLKNYEETSISRIDEMIKELNK